MMRIALLSYLERENGRTGKGGKERRVGDGEERCVGYREEHALVIAVVWQSSVAERCSVV